MAAAGHHEAIQMGSAYLHQVGEKLASQCNGEILSNEQLGLSTDSAMRPHYLIDEWTDKMSNPFI